MPAISMLDFVQSQPEGTKAIVKMFRQGNVLAEYLPAKPVNALIDKSLLELTPGTTAVRRINEPYPSTTNATRVPVDERLLIEGAHVSVDEVLDQFSNGSLLADALADRGMTLGRSAVRRMLNGDGKTDPNDLIGLRDRCDQLDVNHFVVAENGGVLDLDTWYEAKDSVIDQGAGLLFVCNPTQARQLRRAVAAEAGGATIAEVSGQLPELEGVKILVVRHGPDGGPVLGFDESSGTSDETSSAYFIAPGSAETDSGGVRLLVGSQFGRIVNEGSSKGLLSASISAVYGMSVASPRAAVRISGILAAAPD